MDCSIACEVGRVCDDDSLPGVEDPAALAETGVGTTSVVSAESGCRPDTFLRPRRMFAGPSGRTAAIGSSFVPNGELIALRTLVGVVLPVRLSIDSLLPSLFGTSPCVLLACAGDTYSSGVAAGTPEEPLISSFLPACILSIASSTILVGETAGLVCLLLIVPVFQPHRLPVQLVFPF